jgi:hypothetical protein
MSGVLGVSPSRVSPLVPPLVRVGCRPHGLDRVLSDRGESSALRGTDLRRARAATLGVCDVTFVLWVASV